MPLLPLPEAAKESLPFNEIKAEEEKKAITLLEGGE